MMDRSKHPIRLSIKPLGTFVALALLASCSGRLDEQEAATAAMRAQTLYPDEFTRRAPKLTRSAVQKAIAVRLEQMDQNDPGPALSEGDLDLDAPRFVGLDGPTEEVEAIKAICEDLPRHNFQASPYPCKEFVEEIDTLQTKLKSLDAGLSRTNMVPEQVSKVRDHLLLADPKKIREEDGSIADSTLIQVMFGASEQEIPGVLPEAVVHLEGIGKTIHRIADTMARIEIDGHAIFMRYAWDLKARHANQIWLRTSERFTWMNNLADREKKRTKEAQPHLRPYIPADWPTSPTDAQQLALRESMSLLDRISVAQAVRILYPAGDQYIRLLAAHDQYRAILDDGGFVQLPSEIKLKRKRSKHIKALRARLLQEGFNPGKDPEDPEAIDDALRGAIKAYQRAHQLKDNGKVNKDTLAKLNVPARDRVERIRLAMQRWRESTPRDRYYVYVNIPDFHGELWKDGERGHRFRVVVGNTKTGMKDGERSLVNATRVMDAEIDRVILNPYWNVPSRIFKQEILNADLKEMEADDRAEELSSRGYEVVGKGTRGERVRQPPGPGNALGQVKIIFPNPHETYLHDTPSKSLFKRAQRAFSHGCIRVHEPMTLAKMILKNDKQYDTSFISDLVRRWDNHKFFLNNRVPIYIDYITVRVDDNGHVHFLKDVYGHDATRMAMK